MAETSVVIHGRHRHW